MRRQCAEVRPGSGAPARRPAACHRRHRHEVRRETLPFSDRSDFDDAQRGLIARPDKLTIKDASGKVVWDMEQYKQYIGQDKTDAVKQSVQEFLRAKSPGQPDCQEVLDIKTLIRTTEARAAALACGVPPEQLEFMDLRFYRTGTITKAPLHEKDVADVVALLERLRPDQIYVAGEMSDPHGTHRVCADAIFQAVRAVRARGQHFEVWLYRGAWEEWEPHEVERVVPLSPDDVVRKKMAIFRHQSQKDRAVFPGDDAREFWVRAEDRNRETAQSYDRLGLAEYQAMEAFVRYKY